MPFEYESLHRKTYGHADELIVFVPVVRPVVVSSRRTPRYKLMTTARLGRMPPVPVADVLQCHARAGFRVARCSPSNKGFHLTGQAGRIVYFTG